MPDAQPVQGASFANARCAVHPESAATGVCSRCGDYHCGACQKTISGRSLCASCRALPGVDYLEETRARFWGKRDGYVWYYGAFATLSQLLTLARKPAALEPTILAISVVWIVVGLAYLALWRPARIAVVVVSALGALNGMLRALTAQKTLQQLSQSKAPFMGLLNDTRMLMFLAVFGGAVGLVLSLAAYHSPRNKLAFEIEVDERALQRVYDTFVSSTLALRAAWYSLFGFVPFAAIVTFVMGLIALRRADAKAWPPRDGRVPATIAIVISSLWMIGWVGLSVLGH